MLKLKKKTGAEGTRGSMNQDEAGETFEAWMDANNTRNENEAEKLLKADGKSSGVQEYKSRRPTTMRVTQSFRDTETKNQVFFAEDKFRAYLKGIIDVQGRMTAAFTVLVNFGPRIPANDNDYTKYQNYFALHVNKGNAFFSSKFNGKAGEDFDVEKNDETNTDLGLDPDTIQTYWLSYDRDSMVIKYGKGYSMVETTLLTIDFAEKATDLKTLTRKRKKWGKLFAMYDESRPSRDISILLYRNKNDEGNKHKGSDMAAGFINMEGLLEVRKEPLTGNPSPYVLDSSKATLNNIDRGQYIFSSELPPACRVLYETVKNCELDMEFEKGVNDYRLSAAIKYSIDTKGARLNKILKTKPYLRITMGKALGQSPGIPYVLEIWPVGTRSPIHNHGAVCAVIKVLYGTIQNGAYNKVTSQVFDKKGKFRPQELDKFNLYKNDVTWMSPEWYQTHQLRNVSEDYCATVQCYRYDDDDEIQWNQFDFVKDEGEVGNFFPNTDFTFGEMRDEVNKEYTTRFTN